MTKNKSGSLKVSTLNDKQYWKLRNKAVKEVNTSEDKTLADVAKDNHITPSTLWGWCMEDLGPNQHKWQKERSQKIAAKRAVATRKAKYPPSNPATVPVPDPAGPRKNRPWDKKKAMLQTPEHQAIVQAAANAIFGQVPAAPKTLGELMNKSDPRVTLRTAIATGELPTKNPVGCPKKITAAIPHRELMAKLTCCKTNQNEDSCCKTQKIQHAVAINLDNEGKFISYNVTGEVNVLVFSERKVTKA